MTWRHRWRGVIRRTLAELGPRRQLRTKRRALRAAYPGERKGYRYRVWLDECRVQLGLRPPRRRYLDPERIADSPGQQYLFDI